ncbi:MAG: dihydrofolate reductase [Candidatus Levyibacteriota bacterium]
MILSAIAAVGEHRELGKEQKLLWHIPGELPRFKKITTGHPIIMGRKTFESIGRILPNRINIIITRDQNYKVDGAVVCSSLQDAIEKAKQSEGADEIFIIGGGQIFAESLPFVQRLYLTIVKGTFDADVYFPDYSMFTKKIEKEDHDEDGFTYSFVTLER